MRAEILLRSTIVKHAASRTCPACPCACDFHANFEGDVEPEPTYLMGASEAAAAGVRTPAMAAIAESR